MNIEGEIDISCKNIVVDSSNNLLFKISSTNILNVDDSIICTIKEDKFSKKVFDTIKILSKPEHEEIYRIIRKTRDTYTENSNGIFFDLNTISDDAFSQIKSYLDYCLKTRQEEEIRLKELETIRIQNENYVDEDVSANADETTVKITSESS
jgi:hypothetical protein